MSSFYKDPYRKVSEPTEADFVRGMASATAKDKGGAHLALAVAVGLLVRGSRRRKK